MTAEPKIGLYLMSAKGLAVLRCLIERFGPKFIAYVVTAKDPAVAWDCHAEIEQLAGSVGLPVYTRPAAPPPTQHPPYVCAVSWRWLIQAGPSQQLIVFHDSILPRYRGFAPLVGALINGEPEVGVTALLASAEYDRGPIIAQEVMPVAYPMKIAAAIEGLSIRYQNLAVTVGEKILGAGLTFQAQDESLATYSLWRDEQDYFIDWTWDAPQIKRFVDAVGFPYLGAATVGRGILYRILECSPEPDVVIENRTPGKVIFVRKREPVIVCGRGLLQVHQMIEAQSRLDALPLKHFRTLFHTPPPA